MHAHKSYTDNIKCTIKQWCDSITIEGISLAIERATLPANLHRKCDKTVHENLLHRCVMGVGENRAKYVRLNRLVWYGFSSLCFEIYLKSRIIGEAF